MKEPINFAILGGGHIGLRHWHTLQENPDCKVVAICEPAPTEVLRNTIGNIPVFSGLSDLLKTGLSFDVGVICTPNGLHATQSIALLQAGKHVVCEKPMGLTRASCEQVIHTALNVGKQVFVVMQNRFSPAVQVLRNAVNSGDLGDVYLVDIQCFWNRDERYYQPINPAQKWRGTQKMDGGTLFTQFAHFVDILYWVFGDIKNIHATFADFRKARLTEFEDSGFVHFDLVSGGKGSLIYTTATWKQNYTSRITVTAERGTIEIGGQYMNEINYWNCPTPKPNIDTQKRNNHAAVHQNVIDVIKGGKTVATNALEGMKVVEIIERIYAGKS